MVEQTAQQKADASAAWLAQNRPDLVSTPSGSAEQAAATNAAWQNNTLPVLSKMGTPATGYNQNDTIRIYDTTGLTDPRNQQGVARDVTPAEYYQIYGRTPEQSEAAKYQEFNAPIDFAAYANVPLSQMPANVASRVQDYYAAHPTERAQAITAQYAAQHGIVTNPYDEDSAAGIAWEVQRTTGGAGFLTTSLIKEAESPVDKYGQPKSSYTPYGAYGVSGISTVAVRDLSSGMLSGSKTVAALPSGTTTVYMPYGEYAQIEVKDAKALLDYQTGELGVYQLPAGHSYYMLTGGGGRGALQSGMFTVEQAETPYVVGQSDVGKYVLPSGAGLSRLGAEAYGGVVRTMDDRTLEANDAISRYAGTTGKFNLANFVQQIPAGKAEVAGANIPWSVESETPALSYMDERGIIEGSALTIPGVGSLGYPTAIKNPFVSVSASASPEISVKSSVSLENIRESTMGQAPWLFEGIAEVGVWAGSIDILNPQRTTMNIAKNLALDYAADKSYSGAIAHTQAHETGFFNRETLIYGETGSDKLLSTVKGGYGYVSGAEAPSGATAVAHTHTEPLPLLNLLGMYSPVASAEDLSGAATKRVAGITQESVITKGGVLTYATPSFGEVMGSPETYRSATAMGGVLGASNVTQQEFLEKTGTKYNVTPSYVPLSGSIQSPLPTPFVSTSEPQKQAEIEKQVITGSPTYVEAGALPTPFISTSTPSAATVAAQNEYKPSGFLGLGGLLPEIPTYERTKAYAVNMMSGAAENPVGVQARLANDVFGAPVSTAAGVASRLSFGASEVIFKPTPIVENIGSSRSVKTETFDLPTSKSIETTTLPQTSTMSGGNQTITNLGNWLTGNKGSIDLTNKTAVGEYNAKADLFTEMQKQNPTFITTTGGTKTVTSESGGTKVVTTTTGESGQKVYPSEWDKFVEGSGRVGRWLTGETLAKQSAYETTLKGDSSLLGEAKRGLFYAGTEVINKPAELAPAAILGFGMGKIAGAAPSFLAEVGAGTGVTAKAATFLQTPGGASLAKAGVVAGFGSLYTYGVTNKFTATPEETKENIYRSVPTLVAMYGGGGGFNELPRVSVDSLRTLDRILPDIQQSPVRGQPVVRAGPQFISGKEPIKTIDIRETIDLTKSEPREIGAEASRKYKVDVSNLPAKEYVQPPRAADITTKTVAKPTAYQPFIEGTVVGGKALPRENVRTGFGGTRGQSVLESQVSENIPTFDIRQKPQVVNLAEETLISRTAKGRKIETISQAQMRIARTSGETPGFASVGIKNIQRVAGAKTAKETAYQMKLQKQLPSVDGLADIKFGSTADVHGRSVNSLRDAYARAYPTMDTVVKQDIAVASISEAMGAAFPIMDTVVKQGTATEMIQAEKVHLASMEDAKPSLKRPTISENEKSPVPKIGWYPRNVNTLEPTVKKHPISKTWPKATETTTPYQKVDEIFVPYQRTTITEKNTPYTRSDETTIPYSRTTITEKDIPKTSEITKDYPYEKITEKTTPYERIIPIDPVPVVPIVGVPLGNLGGGGGGGGGSKSPWRKVQREMFYIGPKKVVMKRPKMPTMRRKK